MRRAHPFGIGLEERPDEHNAQMIRAKARNRIQIPRNGPRVPVVPAEPPVAGWGVVHAEAMPVQIEAAVIGLAGECVDGVAAHGQYSRGRRTRQELTPLHSALVSYCAGCRAASMRSKMSARFCDSISETSTP